MFIKKYDLQSSIEITILGCRSMLLLLLSENSRTSRHRILRITQEKQSSNLPPRLPPLCNAPAKLGRHKILRRWSVNVYRFY